MSELILDEKEIKKAIKMYIEEKYNIWKPATMVEEIRRKDYQSIGEIVVIYDLDKREKIDAKKRD